MEEREEALQSSMPPGGKVTTWTPHTRLPQGAGSHNLGQRDGGALVVVKAVHGLKAEDHVQAIGEDEQHEQGGEQSHPDARGEEASTVTSIGELLARHVEGLDLGTERTTWPHTERGPVRAGVPKLMDSPNFVGWEHDGRKTQLHS